MSETERPRRVLQENVEQFYRAFASRHGRHMQCAKECARCCYTSLSVFPDEAWEIVLWFRGLTSEEQASLKAAWQKRGNPTGADANGKVQAACAFLVEERCSVYAARPIICRTQGLPLLFRTENKKEKTTELHVDVCPLNFTEEGSLPLRAEFLDLDRVNALQSIATRAFQVPAELVPLVDGQGRVSLSALRNWLEEG